jgi:zinc D-Ala-D-Ala dipeptidase
MSLIEITEKSHDVVLELSYATANNFTGHPVYTLPRCFLHPEGIILLEKAIALAKQQNLRFKIFDAFRPQRAQEKFWEVCPDPMYIADPAKGSNHTRGIAIDLTLINSQNQELDMGTPFDDFTTLSHHGALNLNAQTHANRYLLLGIMMSAGWDLYLNEWWHYQLFNPKIYPLIQETYGIM